MLIVLLYRHCTGDVETSCERRDRDYNVPLRIGLLFVVLATSAIGESSRELKISRALLTCFSGVCSDFDEEAVEGEPHWYYFHDCKAIRNRYHYCNGYDPCKTGLGQVCVE